MSQEIGLSNFLTWKHDEVTKEVFKRLRDAREEINLTLTNADVLLGANSAIAIPRLIGMREALDLMLEISYEDIEEETNESKEALRS